MEYTQIPALDAHCHLSDPRIFDQRQELIARCAQQGVRWFVLGGVDPEDWQRQLILQGEFPEQICCSFGLHPYFVSQAEPTALEQAFRQLETMTDQCSFIGETGLDFRSHIVGERRELQREYFIRQLELARALDKPVVLHIVRAHDEALHILRKHPVRGIVHAFNSSWEVAEKYLALDLYLSLGAPVLRPEHQTLVERIPIDRLLLESDAPDQPPQGQKTHEPTTVLSLAERIAANKDLTSDAVLEKTKLNMETLLKRRLT